MPVYLRCEQCQKRLKIPAEVVGRAIKCPACGGVFKSDASKVLPEPARPSPSPVAQVLAPVAAAPPHQPEARTPEPETEDVVPARPKAAAFEDDDEEVFPARKKAAVVEDDEDEDEARPARKKVAAVVEDEDDEDDELDRAKAARRRTPWYVMLPLILLSLSAAGIPWLWALGFTILGVDRHVQIDFDTRMWVGIGTGVGVILLCLVCSLIPVRAWLRFVLVLLLLGLGYGGSFAAVSFWKDLPFGK